MKFWTLLLVLLLICVGTVANAEWRTWYSQETIPVTVRPAPYYVSGCGCFGFGGYWVQPSAYVEYRTRLVPHTYWTEPACVCTTVTTQPATTTTTTVITQPTPAQPTPAPTTIYSSPPPPVPSFGL